MKKNIFIPLFLMISLLTACNDWLDVKPKSQVEGSDLFKDESGYKDALTGVYTAMTSASMYGQEMTYGLVDVIGDVYYSAGNSTYGYAKNHLYDNSDVESIINTIWAKSYNVIATINNILQNLEKADPTLFSKDNYYVIKGELLGLRAFLHFDLLRLFAPSWKVGAKEESIPYVVTYSYQTTPLSTVEEVLSKIGIDLKNAEACLKVADPIYTGREITTATDNGYLMHRYYHFNYYAVKATMARVYLYQEDRTNAHNCALEVINSGKFPWTGVDNIATAQNVDRDRTFTSEQIFALQIDALEDYVLGKVYGTVKYTAIFTVYKYWMDYGIWPSATHATDWRRLYFMTSEGTNNSSYFVSSKLWQEEMNQDYIKRMPLIRLPEMYLILAETDMKDAAAHLNTIRDHRGVTARVTATEEQALLDEIGLEYYREFIGEGQMFYWYKRLHCLTHRGGWYFDNNVSFNPDLYVLPIPQEEIEYGNRNGANI